MLLSLLRLLGGWLLSVVKPSSILFHPLGRLKSALGLSTDDKRHRIGL